jgi:hypothetical protein
MNHVEVCCPPRISCPMQETFADRVGAAVPVRDFQMRSLETATHRDLIAIFRCPVLAHPACRQQKRRRVVEPFIIKT